MNPKKYPDSAGRVRRSVARVLACIIALSVVVPRVSAVSSWNPTLIVSTESFQEIDQGDGTTSVDLRFGSSSSTLTLLTTGKFQFNKSLSVVGGLSGSYLTIDHQANISGSLVVKNNAAVLGNLSGSSFYGAGLGDCNNGTTSKLIYDAATGKFSCGTDQTSAGSTYFAGQGLSLNGSVFSLNQVITGSTLYTQNGISTSGSLLVVQYSAGAGATSEGPNSPATLTNDNSFGSEAWINPENAAASDNSFAYVETVFSAVTTNYLKATNFGFNIPSGATIDGIIAEIEKASSSGGATDARIRLVKGGTIQSTDKSSVDNWPPGLGSYATHGGASDLWSDTWSASDINASDFGIAISASVDGNGETADVDHIRITVHYTDNGVKKIITATGGKLGVGTATPETELEVVGAISGSRLTISNNANISGSLVVKNNAAVLGNLSGSSFYGAGLGDCNNGTTSKLIYNASTGKFSCATDETGAGGGLSYGTASGIFVKRSGSTMTGTLILVPQFGLALNARGTVSGTNLRISGAADVHGALTASGAFRTDGNITINDDADSNDAVLTFGNLTLSQTLKFLNTNQKFQFSKSLSVVGSISGSSLTIDGVANISGATLVKGNLSTKGALSGAQLHLMNLGLSGGILFNSGSLVKATAKGGSGQVLVSRGTGTPEWKNPKGSMVWYLDSTIATGVNQGAIVTMPFGMTLTSVSLRMKGAPTGAALIVDLNQNGTTIFSTRPQVNDGATTGGSSAVFSNTNLTEGSEITLDVDQVGSTFAGSGMTIMLNGVRSY